MRSILPSSLGLLLVCATVTSAQVTPPTRPDTTQPLPTVVVTATRDTISPLASPLPTAVLTSEDLRRDHHVSIGHTLTRLAGVRSLSTGEQTGKPVIRGLSGSRVLVLDNGLRLEDYSWSDEDAPSIDARLADRIEVIRGPASVLYGSDALGGVVNTIPTPLLDARGGGAIARGHAELYGASNNREAGLVLGGDGARGHVGVRGEVIARIGQDVHTPAGEILNTGFGAVNGEAALGYHHDSGAESLLRFTHFGGEYKLLEIDAPPGGATEEEGPERITLDDRLQLTHRRPVGGLDVEVRGQVQRHLLQEKADLPNPQPGQPKEATVFDLLLTTGTVDLLAHHGALEDGSLDLGGSSVRPMLSGTVGVSGLFQQNDSRGIVPLVPDAAIASGGVFAFERVAFGPFALLGGARYDVRHVRNDADPRLDLDDGSRTSTAVTGDIGAVYRAAPSLSLAVNAGSAWRAPNLFELFANGPRLGEGRYEYGLVSLDPERSFNLDASVRWDARRVHAEVSGFRNRIHDFTFISPTNETQDGLRVYRYGQGDATLVGGETSASIDATDILTLRGRFDAVRGANETTDDPLPLMPPHREAIGVELHGNAGRLGAAYVSADLEHVARQDRLSDAERDATVEPGRFPLTTDAYTLLDLGAGIVVPVAHHTTRLDLRVSNATDHQYRDFLSRYKEFAYAPGMNIIVRATTTF